MDRSPSLPLTDDQIEAALWEACEALDRAEQAAEASIGQPWHADRVLACTQARARRGDLIRALGRGRGR